MEFNLNEGSFFYYFIKFIVQHTRYDIMKNYGVKNKLQNGRIKKMKGEEIVKLMIEKFKRCSNGNFCWIISSLKLILDKEMFLGEHK
jgi:hypothetical protein